MGSYETSAWCMACEFDRESSYAFVADYSGKINILHLKQDGYTHMTALQGHQSKGRGWWEGGVSAGGGSLGCVCDVDSVRALSWDQERRMLFSGGFDQVIVIWDIGSRQGIAYELCGHK